MCNNSPVHNFKGGLTKPPLKLAQFNVSFNDKEIEQVGRYKYLGNIIRRIDKPTHDSFAYNHKYLSDQARKTMFCAKIKINDIGVLPPHIMFYIFDTIVRPITTYGSDVWGCNLDLHYTENVFLDFIKYVLRVKATTCTTIIYGEWVHLPPSVICYINALAWLIDYLHCLCIPWQSQYTLS